MSLSGAGCHAAMRRGTSGHPARMWLLWAFEGLSDQSSRATTSPWLMGSEGGPQRCGLEVLKGGAFLLWLLPVGGVSPKPPPPAEEHLSMAEAKHPRWIWKGELSRSIITCFFPHLPATHRLSSDHSQFLLQSFCFSPWKHPPHWVGWSQKGDSLKGCKGAWQALLPL